MLINTKHIVFFWNTVYIYAHRWTAVQSSCWVWDVRLCSRNGLLQEFDWQCADTGRQHHTLQVDRRHNLQVDSIVQVERYCPVSLSQSHHKWRDEGMTTVSAAETRRDVYLYVTLILSWIGVLHGLGRLNVSHLIMLRKVTFYKHLFLSANSVLCNVFHFTLIHNYYGYAILRTVFMPLYLAVELVFQSFADYVGWGV